MGHVGMKRKFTITVVVAIAGTATLAAPRSQCLDGADASNHINLPQSALNLEFVKVRGDPRYRKPSLAQRLLPWTHNMIA